jgi:hypothetical protein
MDPTRPLLDKLGVKPADLVAVVGVDDVNFRDVLKKRLLRPARARPTRGMNMIFYAADSVAALARLEKLRSNLTPEGAIWVVSRKGKEATLKDTEVMAAGKQAGLVDTKVVAFSATHTALKFVIPLADRPLRKGPSRRSS